MKNIRLLLMLVFLAACQAEATETPTPAVTPPATTTSAPETAAPAETAALEDGVFTNPVLDRDFPDPEVLQVGDEYYAYSTNSDGVNIPVARSSDLVNWEVLGDALPVLPEWARQEFGWAWAPGVDKPVGSDEYLMYFTARFAMGMDGIQCIGLASSPEPQGPFTPQGEEPLVCQHDQNGSIDADLFLDGDQHYLLWKSDNNNGGGATHLWIQPISADGRTLQGEPVRLLTAGLRWEGIVIEGPVLRKHEGKYYLFYSANVYNSPDYAVGYAVSDNLLGPYTKNPDPLIKTTVKAGLVGPGGQDLVTDPDGDPWILVHGWTPEAYRAMYLLPMDWEDGKPTLPELSRDPMPIP